MASIEFHSSDGEYMAALSQQLTTDLEEAALDQDLQVGEPETESGPVTRG